MAELIFSFDPTQVENSVAPIVATRYPVLPSYQVPSSLLLVSTSRKPWTIAAVTVFTTKEPVEIVKIKTNWEGKSLFQPITTAVLSSAKLSATSLAISVPRKQYPVTTDYIIPRVDIVGPGFD